MAPFILFFFDFSGAFLGPLFWCLFGAAFLVPVTTRGQNGLFVRLGWTVLVGMVWFYE
ncbi:hypothetical protein [Neobacillus sp. DY30]|uniref:hypothetical protein n=1 Tax=Neobacillus sp. DY30 TaxID=3047871 RepID=UPI0024BF1C70|nr:hypothetical protein [Neobacillus sp. DY30]WHX98398.1 hypothetical protein QNH29_17255 [Neobacillus sp. DY30]